MQESLQRACDRLIGNYERIVPGNRMEYDTLLVAGAAMYLTRGEELDPERLEMCRRLLKQRKGVFSSFRGIAEFIVRCKMALSPDPERYLERLDAVYGALGSFFSGDQVLLAATVIADLAAPEKQDEAVQKTKALYAEMRKAHPWLTSQEDMPFAALMAVTAKDGAAVYEEAEKVYELLKENLKASGESRQMLSHILALYQDHAENKCGKLCALDEGLRSTKHPLDRNRCLPILGTLAASRQSADELVAMIGEADDYLKQFKPFKGLFGVGSDIRRMAAVQLVESVTGGGACAVAEPAAVASVVSSSINVTIVTLIMIYTIIEVTSAASSANH